MDNGTLAKILERVAKRDLFDGVGRILLSELRQEIGECITPENVLHCWREAYPNWRIDQRTSNIILVFFEASMERMGRNPVLPSFDWEE